MTSSTNQLLIETETTIVEIYLPERLSAKINKIKIINYVDVNCDNLKRLNIITNINLLLQKILPPPDVVPVTKRIKFINKLRLRETFEIHNTFLIKESLIKFMKF